MGILEGIQTEFGSGTPYAMHRKSIIYNSRDRFFLLIHNPMQVVINSAWALAPPKECPHTPYRIIAGRLFYVKGIRGLGQGRIRWPRG